MPSLQDFTNFVRSTGEKLRSKPDEIINDAVKNTYFLSRALKGRDVAQSIQSGKKIVDRILLSDVGTATFYHPNDDLDIQGADAMVSIEENWRFIVDHFTYTEAEVELNSGDPQTYHKNYLKGKRQQCQTSTFNKMEDQIWAQASNADMESDDGKQPYSIPAFITTDGLAPSGFTTVMNQNPTTEAGWRNQTETYDPTAITDFNNGLIRAFDRMWHKSRFVAPLGGTKEYFESDLLQKMVIASNLDGVTTLQALTRDSNDRLAPANNLGWVAGKVTYSGIPVEYISTLDTALVNGGSAIPDGEPWFYWINLSYLFPIFHGRKYMSEKAPKEHPRQPFSYVVWKNTFYNWFCASRKRQGLISAA